MYLLRSIVRYGSVIHMYNERIAGGGGHHGSFILSSRPPKHT